MIDRERPDHLVIETSMEKAFTCFVRSLEAHGYAFRALAEVAPVLALPHAYLRHDVRPEDLDAGLRLAALHQKLRVPGSFHLIWDRIENDPQLTRRARRFGEFDPAYVHLGLQADPITGWLLRTRFAASESRLAGFVDSPEYPAYLGDMLAAWRIAGAAAPVLRSIREGAWERLVGLDRSFRQTVGHSSSISGRGSPLSNAFLRACEARPELAAIAAWFSPIDFLVSLDLARLGYAFEATRFAWDGIPGPVVMFGGVEISRLRESFQTRMAGGGGFVAIFPAQYWDGDHYSSLLPAEPASSVRRPKPPSASACPNAAAAPDQPVLTNLADLAAFGPNCERVDTAQLAAAARQKVGPRIDADFPRFIEWLRGEGYSFGGFEQGMPRFGERWAYLRHDVHIQDLLAAYVLAELHQQLAVVGSFQITWKFSRYEEAAEPYFVKLLEFDRRFVQFGLHAAPTATWYLNEKLAGDYPRQREAVATDDFLAWLLELHAAYTRDGEAARELRQIREGTDDTFAHIAALFRETFGDWKSVSGHGNFLTNGFTQACASHPQLKVLQPYFHPVAYMAKYGVDRFGFDFEITAFGADAVPFPRVIMEGAAEETRRGWYRGRVCRGAGFVALFHPASWTCRHNAGFFQPADLAEAGAVRPSVTYGKTATLDAAIARLREIVRQEWVFRGEDPSRDPAAGNIEYNSGNCGWRAAVLLDFAERAYGFSMPGKAVAELGSGFGGLCLHWALEHGAGRILAVDQVPCHVAATQTIVGEFGLPGFTVIEADLQAFAGHDESVDLVVLSDVLLTADLSPARIARTCARLLRPDGIVLFRHVNRAYGRDVASHRDGTQFLDPESADLAARFLGRGSGSTLAHRPLSPWGLAAFLRQAGFEEFRLCGDDEPANGSARASRGLQSHYRLGARKKRTGGGPPPRPLPRRLRPPSDGFRDRAPFRNAVDRRARPLGAAAERLRRLFGGRLAREQAYAELRAYLIGRLLLNGLSTFRSDCGDQPARDFAVAIERALDHALAAVLIRHAQWEQVDFHQADPGGFTAVLAECTRVVLRGFRQPADEPWTALVDWAGMAKRAVQILLHGRGADRRVDARAEAVTALRLQGLVADRFRLHQIDLFARTADPLTGSVEEEYGEAAIDRIEGEVLDIVEPAGNGPRPMHRDEMIDLVEEIQDQIAAGAPQAIGVGRTGRQG